MCERGYQTGQPNQEKQYRAALVGIVFSIEGLAASIFASIVSFDRLALEVWKVGDSDNALGWCVCIETEE